MNKVPMTVAGEKSLREELNHLKGEARPQVIAAIAEAREHGDLKENAEYHAAREQQGFIEGRIQEIESKLSGAQVIDVTKLPKTGKVIFGVTVSLLNLDSDASVTYRIVGEDEADIKAGRISVTSPIARALIGKEEGDVVVVKTPGPVPFGAKCSSTKAQSGTRLRSLSRVGFPRRRCSLQVVVVHFGTRPVLPSRRPPLPNDFFLNKAYRLNACFWKSNRATLRKTPGLV